MKLDAAMQRHLAARYLVPEPRNALAKAVRLHASPQLDEQLAVAVLPPVLTHPAVREAAVIAAPVYSANASCSRRVSSARRK